MVLSQKETILLEDLKSQEKLCVEKYSQYASDASDGQLKNLFSQIGQTEKEHLNTIEQMLGGTVPTMTNGSGWQQQSKTQTSSNTQASPSSSNSTDKQKDNFLCSDVLSSEKHVSSVYNTCIFEFKDEQARNALNHIQKEEQEHGKKIYDYMSSNGMYS